MSVLKCKMCGGTLNVSNDSGVAVCEYCGTKQTITKSKDDVLSNLYNRANNLRLKNEFDKALNVYEKIIEQDDSEAEAHWGVVLCKYGIEYVDDPLTGKKIPTCHRTSFDSIKTDIDYQAAIDYADPGQQLLYEEEARTIDRLQKDILNIAKSEKPFDVFICYKETDDDGKRTIDSVVANDIYYQLTQEGFKVFYAAITLEDKLGQEYEPYIFAALNSAKVMLVIGTKPEYFNAVWVKNEWSRYLSLMKKDRSKILIPCYRDMDAYDLPDEFAHLQAQDMSKIGFINDVIRGIKKILPKEEKKDIVRQEPSRPQSSVNTASLLKRAKIFLEDGVFQSADEYFDRVLDNDPENGEAYLGKLMVSNQLTNMSRMIDYYIHLFDEEKYVDRKVVINDGHVEDILGRYTVSNYLSEDQIKEKYRFDSQYQSLLDARIEQKDQIEKEFKDNRTIARSLRYANKETLKAFETIRTAYEQRIEEARAKDDERINAVQEEYKNFVAQIDSEIEEDYKKAIEKRENDYQECLKKAERILEQDDWLDDYQYIKMVISFCEIFNDLSGVEKYKEKALNALAVVKEKAEEQIEDLEEKISEINRKLIEKDGVSDSLKKIEKEIADVEKEKSELKATLSKLGIFDTRAKNEIRENLFRIDKEKVELDKEKAQLTVKMNYLSELENKKNNCSIELEKTKDNLVSFELDGDTDSELNLDRLLYNLEFHNVKIGSYIKLGNYIQTKNKEPEPIEWIVLDKKDDRMLVISRYALDNRQFNSSRTAVAWESSSLREWLNNKFYEKAFSEWEKKLILTSLIIADKNPDYPTSQGNDTQDKIFLLSIKEADGYFKSNFGRQCKATEYTNSLGAFKSKDDGNCCWWLRTSGYGSAYAVYVRNLGAVYTSGYYVDGIDYAIRPAMWISLK